MENVISWHVAVSLCFVLSFLMMVAVEAWRNANVLMITVGRSIRGAAARFPWGSSGSAIRRHQMWRDEKSVSASLLSVDVRSPRTDIGSRVIAAAAFLLIAFRQTDVLPYVPLALSPARFVLVGAACLWLLTRLTGQRSEYRLGALGVMLWIYALAFLFAYAAQMTRATAAPNLDQLLIVEMLLIVVVLLCFNVIHDYVGLRRVIKGLVAGAVVSAVVALLGTLSGSPDFQLRLPGLVNQVPLNFSVDDLVRDGMVRAQGSASHPLELACVLSVIFPLALGLTLSLRAAGSRWWPWAMATATILAGITVTLARSGAVGVVVALAVIAVYWPIRRTLKVLAGIGCIFAGGVFLQVPAITGYLSIFGADRSVEQRAAVTSALPFHISPFGSLGLATGASTPGTEVPTLDDQYLSALAKIGVVGLVAYVILVGTTVTLAFLAVRNVRKRTDSRLPSEAAQLFVGIAASLSAYVAVSIFFDTAGFLQIWTLMWLLIAISAVAYRISRTPGGLESAMDGSRSGPAQTGQLLGS